MPAVKITAAATTGPASGPRPGFVDAGDAATVFSLESVVRH